METDGTSAVGAQDATPIKKTVIRTRSEAAASRMRTRSELDRRGPMPGIARRPLSAGAMQSTAHANAKAPNANATVSVNANANASASGAGTKTTSTATAAASGPQEHRGVGPRASLGDSFGSHRYNSSIMSQSTLTTVTTLDSGVLLSGTSNEIGLRGVPAAAPSSPQTGRPAAVRIEKKDCACQTNEELIVAAYEALCRRRLESLLPESGTVLGGERGGCTESATDDDERPVKFLTKALKASFSGDSIRAHLSAAAVRSAAASRSQSRRGSRNRSASGVESEDALIVQPASDNPGADSASGSGSSSRQSVKKIQSQTTIAMLPFLAMTNARDSKNRNSDSANGSSPTPPPVAQVAQIAQVASKAHQVTRSGSIRATAQATGRSAQKTLQVTIEEPSEDGSLSRPLRSNESRTDTSDSDRDKPLPLPVSERLAATTTVDTQQKLPRPANGRGSASPEMKAPAHDTEAEQKSEPKQGPQATLQTERAQIHVHVLPDAKPSVVRSGISLAEVHSQTLPLRSKYSPASRTENVLPNQQSPRYRTLRPAVAPAFQYAPAYPCACVNGGIRFRMPVLATLVGPLLPHRLQQGEHLAMCSNSRLAQPFASSPTYPAHSLVGPRPQSLLMCTCTCRRQLVFAKQPVQVFQPTTQTEERRDSQRACGSLANGIHVSLMPSPVASVAPVRAAGLVGVPHPPAVKPRSIAPLGGFDALSNISDLSSEQIDGSSTHTQTPSEAETSLNAEWNEKCRGMGEREEQSGVWIHEDHCPLSPSASTAVLSKSPTSSLSSSTHVNASESTASISQLAALEEDERRYSTFRSFLAQSGLIREPRDKSSTGVNNGQGDIDRSAGNVASETPDDWELDLETVQLTEL